MKLIQLSTKTCPPCKMARKYITSKYANSPNIGSYEWVDVQDTQDEKILSLIVHLEVRSVPTFAVVDDLDILDVFQGFNTKRIDRFFEGGYNSVGESSSDNN